MSQLSGAIDNVLCKYEDMDIEISLLSFLMLDYHVSTNEHKYGHQALKEVYGYSTEQLEVCYAELVYYGYIKLNFEFISFNDKANDLFKKVARRMTTDERKLLDANFEIFWKSYPIKVGKKRAKFEWMKLRPSKEITDKIMSAIVVQKKFKADADRMKQFVPEFQHAERWIKHERYDDEYVTGKNFIKMNTKLNRDER